MNTITVAFLRMFSLSIGALLGIFCNCGGCMRGPVVEYGMPHADYTISGTVRSADANLPVFGLFVSIRDTLDTAYILDTAATDSLGMYSLEFSTAPWKSTWLLRVKDVDSMENGPFIEKDTVISIPESDLRGASGSWYEGHGEKVVDVKVERRN
jgi:putative lipoprotein (rSAM/lipoprotein system)